MLPSERQELIYKWVCEEKTLSLEDLSGRLNTSAMTIRRDLDLLQQEGMLKRVRGGAMTTDEPSTNFYFHQRSQEYVEQKSAIAEFAAKNLVQDNDIILMEGGTTVFMMANHLKQSNLTILTNGLCIISQLASGPSNYTVMASGGSVDYSEQIFIGPQAASFFTNFRAHKCFLGADGLTLEDGATEANLAENEVKRAMVQCAKETIILIDSHKIGSSSLVQAINLDQIDTIVTDKGAPQDVLTGLQKKGIKVHIV
ncbi:MAG: DeoR/GlpR transcriptional regulator [Phycisphaerae bacterium]|nr:DeoR/GlpR transcriptional regulator [Phycisphaerae bacterium]